MRGRRIDSAGPVRGACIRCGDGEGVLLRGILLAGLKVLGL